MVSYARRRDLSHDNQLSVLCSCCAEANIAMFDDIEEKVRYCLYCY